MGAATSILINVGAQTASAIKGITGVNKALGQQATVAQKAHAGIKKAALPAAAAMTALGGAAVGFAKAAAEDAAASSRMAANLAKSTGATDAQVASLEDWITKQGQALGMADDQLRPAMERLARATGDLGEAQQLATIAMDVSAATGKDMVTVSNAMAKAHDGQVGALKKLGVTLGPQAENMIEYTAAQNALAKAQVSAQAAMKDYGPASKQYAAAAKKVADAQSKVNTLAQAGTDWVGELGAQFSGAAATSADTAAGKMERLQLSLAEMGESIGAALLPPLEALLPLLQGFAAWASNNTTTLTVIAGVIAALAAAVLVANAALAAWSAITTIWSAVTAIATAVGAAFGAVVAVITSPVFLVIAAIVALIAIVVLLAKNWDTVKNALGRAWEWLKAKAIAVFGAIKAFLASVWNAIKATVTSVWNGIKSFIGGVFAAIKAVISTYVNAWKAIISTVLNTIKTIFTNAWNGIRNGVSTAFNLIKTAVTNGITNVLNLVRKLPGQILSAIGNFGSLLYDKGKQLIQGLIDGIKAMAGAIMNAIRNLIPGPLRRFIPGLNSFSVAAPGVTSMGASTTGSVVINWYGGPVSDARVVKRILEADDLRQGRPRGAALRAAW